MCFSKLNLVNSKSSVSEVLIDVQMESSRTLNKKTSYKHVLFFNSNFIKKIFTLNLLKSINEDHIKNGL